MRFQPVKGNVMQLTRKWIKKINAVYSLEGTVLENMGPVVQSVVSLTSSLRVISLTVLVDSIHNILIFFAEKM